ncbi:MAG: CDP-alcohol phosphatidyltransferase family protein [Patescibacteria group bacterium]
MDQLQNTARKITLPNAITLFRLIGAPIFFILLYLGYSTTFPLFVVLVVSDFLDGRIARWQGSMSLWGEKWDPIADKILVLPLLLYFLSIGQARFVPVFLICFRELIIIYFRGLANSKNIRTPSLFMGKLKMVFESIALGLFILEISGLANIVLWLAMIFAMVSLIQYALRWQFVREYIMESALYRIYNHVIRANG